MSDDATTVPPVQASVNNKIPPAAWFSSWNEHDASLVLNPQDGHEVWVLRPNGTIENKLVVTRPPPGIEPCPLDVNFTGDVTMPTLRALLSHFRFAPRNGSSAFRADLIILVWIVSLFLRGIMTTKPILLLTGGIGSGKSTLARLIGRVLLGKTFDVVRLPAQRRDYPAVMGQMPLVALDQVEQMPKWLADDLATQATGGRVPMRKLWTDADLHSIALSAYVIITCATPEWVTAFILDRCLVLTMQKVTVRVPDRRLNRFVDANREAILSECITVAREAYLTIMANEPVLTQDFRLADFAAYGSVVAEVIEGEAGRDAFLATLTAMSDERIALSEETDPLLAALIAIARDDAEKGEAPAMTSGQLMHRLSIEMSGQAAGLSAVANPTALGKAIAALRTKAAGLVNIEVTRPQNKARYRLRLASDGYCGRREPRR